MTSLRGSRLVPSLFLLLTTIWLCGLPHSTVRAQVLPEAVDTLIVETTRAPLDLGTITTTTLDIPTNVTTTAITGGTRPANGPNLFHSFDYFSVGTGDIAHFQNDMMLPTTNIIARVIGDGAGLRQASTIDGILRTNNPLNTADPFNFGSANLYLVNPAGIIFGPNAQLDVKGSFAATTADYLRLTDGGILHTDPVQPSVLSIANVAAFGFTSPRPVAILVQPNLATDPPLAVATGQSLSLIGGDINILGADNGNFLSTSRTLSSPSGRVNLASVASLGEVVLNSQGEPPNLDVRSFEQLGVVHIGPDASVNVAGDPGGTILIRADHFQLDQSQLTASTLGPVDHAGTAIDVEVTGDITLIGGTLSGAEFGASTFGTGNAGNVRIVADGLELVGVPTLSANANIGSRSFSTAPNGGDGGLIDITANHILLRDLAFINTFTQGGGNAGSIILQTGSLELLGGPVQNQSGVFIGTNTFSSGNAGALRVSADSVLMRGKTDFTGLSSQVSTGAGSAGPLILTTRELQVLDGAQISAGLFGGAGSGGSVDVTAETVLISGTDARGFSAGIFAATNFPATGNGGQIRVAADDLTVTNRGQINAFSSGFGNSGNIDLQVRNLAVTTGASVISTNFGAGLGGSINVEAETVRLAGPGPGSFTGFFAIGGFAASRAGDITVRTGNLDIVDGALISARTSGIGQGGTIDVTADRILISGTDPTSGSAAFDGISAGITASNLAFQPRPDLATGNAGNIRIEAGALDLRNDGTIRALSTGLGNAGTITIDAGTLDIASGAVISGESTGIGNAGVISVDADQVTIMGRATSSDPFGVDLTGLSTKTITGAGGTVTVNADSLTVSDQGFITSATTGTGNAGSIGLTGTNLSVTGGARIEASTQGVGNAGNITITNTDTVSVTGLSSNGSTRSGIFAKTQSPSTGAGGGGAAKPGNAGNITIASKNLLLSSGAQIDSSTTSGGAGGSVSITTIDNITIVGSSTRLTSDATRGDGQGGNITLVAKNITVRDNASVTAATGGRGDAGNVTLTALNQLLLQSAGTVTTSTQGSGKGGTIIIQAGQVLLDGVGTAITADTLRPFADLTITINILHLNDGDLVVQLDSPTGTRVALLSRVGGTGDNFTGTQFNDQATTQITSGSAPFTGTFKPREPLAQLISELVAGNWTLNVRDQATGNAGSLESWTLQIGAQTFQSTSGSRVIPDNGNVRSTITVAAPTVPTVQGIGEAPGIGGNVTVNAGTITVRNGATMSATTRGSGQGGTLTVKATGPVALTGPGSGLFTNSEASGAGGSINLQAARMTMDNGATVSAASSRTGDAGNITINAGSEFLSTNSSVTTAATQASGGNITLLATDMIHLKDSRITASVLGGPQTAGGNIRIDPNFIILQNSQIIAQAFQGAGGNINLTFNQALLTDARSTISASSQFGVNGTVNINSPSQNLSGALVPLEQSFLSGNTISNQRCAARMAQGQISTFIVTEREGLPQEPGGMLLSSLVETDRTAALETIEPIRAASVSQSFFTPATPEPVQLTWTDDTCRR